MNRGEYRLILRVLKKTLKSQGYTYIKLANKLSVSEATVRRIFAGYECNVGRLFDICDVLKISFLETVQMALQNRTESFFLTKKQEEYFAHHPQDYGFFRTLYYGKTLEEVCLHWNLTESQAFTRLRRLERLELIDLYPNNLFKFRVRGQMSWSDDGPMVRTLLRARSHDFLDGIFDSIAENDTCFQAAEVDLTFDELEDLINEINTLSLKYTRIGAKTRHVIPNSKRRSVAWVMGAAPYSTDWRNL